MQTKEAASSWPSKRVAVTGSIPDAEDAREQQRVLRLRERGYKVFRANPAPRRSKGDGLILDLKSIPGRSRRS